MSADGHWEDQRGYYYSMRSMMMIEGTGDAITCCYVEGRDRGRTATTCVIHMPKVCLHAPPRAWLNLSDTSTGDPNFFDGRAAGACRMHTRAALPCARIELSASRPPRLRTARSQGEWERAAFLFLRPPCSGPHMPSSRQISREKFSRGTEYILSLCWCA